ncbi:MAG: Flp pilus assembly complex ATPase component TadA, partial [Elusimicrobia bacterium]|nr:Flp pilus assembly complex ATPase component TadA [Elusimicrobiota bacterium]
MARQKIGELLVQNGILTDEQLNRAVRFQSQANCLLGEAVVRMGFATEEAIAVTLSKQLGIPYASIENQILKPERDQSLEKVVSEKFARDHCILPLFLENGTMVVAMADPMNVVVLDNLKLLSGMEIQPFIATRAQILRTIDEFYTGGSRNLIDKAMEVSSAPGKEGDIDLEMDSVEEKLDLDKVVAKAQGAQVVGLVNAVLKQALSERASDIHLENYDERVSLRFRIDGVLYERSAPPKDTVVCIISRIKILSKLDIAERRLPQDGNFAVKLQNRTVEIRVSTLPTVFGEKLVLRLLDKGAVELNIEKLGFEPLQRECFLKAAKYPHGLIFLTGPTGSGKTTTLYSVLNTIRTPEKNFLTVEDPVEYKLSGINQVQVKPQIG